MAGLFLRWEARAWSLPHSRFKTLGHFTKLICLSAVFFLFLTGNNVYGQIVGTQHVFPRMVDGAFADGSYYASTVLVTNTSVARAACTLSLFGLGPERLNLSSSFRLEGSGGYIIHGTKANAFPFAAGYAKLDCDQPVSAVLLYQYVSAASSVLGLATVFSAPPAQSYSFPGPTFLTDIGSV